MSKLTIKQENFCNYYIESGNASEAYRRAFSCDNMKADTIHVKAKELLNNGKITVRVKELQAEVKNRSDLKKDEAVNELSNIVRVRITNIMQIKGDTITVRNLEELPDEIVSAISSIKQTNAGIEIKLYDKISAIDRLSKMKGWDEPTKNEHTGKDGKDLISSIQIIDKTGLFK